ncbi:type I 3-dehydroquinate dehydratase [Rhodococcus sp. IEGM 1408]|uniref:type I 3-dehydroquinate dehydratase n=1 Tax=Rhodococcus sp. IEGM 1408 TaxID=3082220 RepID=UPI002953E390|nr:type I 3-dehydroquinate dehydratase [Rhodococcus sp. IEGM 1408]MDV7999797.1 type I 3-dehydroquinate dehydratase [Rhodococcus sp. IEGM 1408]
MPRHPFALDASSPSIIVPLTAHDLPQLEEQVAALSSRAAEVVHDAVEWRVDLFAPFIAGGGSDPAPAVSALHRIAELLPETPILATFRTIAEGGGADITPEAYLGLIGALASTGLAAAIDVEYRHPRAAEAIDVAHAHHTPVVASNHDFHGTPPVEEIVERLEAMELAGAEVAKIAVTPRTPAEVLILLDATERRHRTSGIPLITMSMGALGAVTRICGGTFGSAATFATVGSASAPGQLPAAGVRSALDLLRTRD